jgi:tetratricopeptide (TPR) repeat protein
MKQVASHFGGTRNGLVMSWPKGITCRGELRSQFHHAIDIAPTILELAGIPEPNEVNGVPQKPIEGVSMAYTFSDKDAPSKRNTQYFEMFGNRALYHDGWVAGCVHGRLPWQTAGSASFDEDTWELYNIDEDFSQANDLAAKQPKKLRDLQDRFMAEAAKYNVLPLDDRFAERANPKLKPNRLRGRSSFVYPRVRFVAGCYTTWAWAGDIFAGDPSPAVTLPRVRDAATRALRLDENLAEAHTSLACVKLILNWDWKGAEQEFKRAIELNSSYSPAHTWYAHYLVAMGRFDESAAEAKRSLELDPFSQFTMDYGEWAYYLGRHYDLAIEQSRKSSELASEFPWSHYDLGQVYQWTGRTPEAIEEYTRAQELFGLSKQRVAELRNLYRESGEKGYWRKTLEFCEEASKQTRKFATTSGYGWCDYVKNLDLAAIHVHLGQLDAAFQLIDPLHPLLGPRPPVAPTHTPWRNARAE